MLHHSSMWADLALLSGCSADVMGASPFYGFRPKPEQVPGRGIRNAQCIEIPTIRGPAEEIYMTDRIRPFLDGL
jgi:hypothetical protein